MDKPAEPFYRYRYGKRSTEPLQPEENAISVLHLLNRFDTAQCMDPRDRVYAMQRVERSAVIDPDYSASVEKVYTDFAGELATHGYADHILVAAVCRNDLSMSKTEGTMPSWVPDWRNLLTARTIESPLWRIVQTIE